MIFYSLKVLEISFGLINANYALNLHQFIDFLFTSRYICKLNILFWNEFDTKLKVKSHVGKTYITKPLSGSFCKTKDFFSTEPVPSRLVRDDTSMR